MATKKSRDLCKLENQLPWGECLCPPQIPMLKS